MKSLVITLNMLRDRLNSNTKIYESIFPDRVFYINEHGMDDILVYGEQLSDSKLLFYNREASLIIKFTENYSP